MMNSDKKPFKQRAFTAIMSGLTALTLPFTGLILHGYSEGAINGDRHAWFMLHVGLGILFVVFAAWHAVLNRRALLSYIKGVGGSLPGK
jgi:hypothetical protein